MAEITQTRVLPPEFIEAAGKVALGDLATATGQFKTADLSKVFGQQFVAGQDPLQAQAQTLATQGIGAYQPFLNQAQAAQTTAGGLTGPTAFRQFMSPYQQDVIDTTLREFDVQAQKGLPALAAQAINAGAFGGGREGVQRAEYQQASDRNRAALQAQLLQQGFGQAQTAAQQAFLNQQTLGNQQLNLAGQQQAFLGQDVVMSPPLLINLYGSLFSVAIKAKVLCSFVIVSEASHNSGFTLERPISKPASPTPLSTKLFILARKTPEPFINLYGE